MTTATAEVFRTLIKGVWIVEVVHGGVVEHSPGIQAEARTARWVADDRLRRLGWLRVGAWEQIERPAGALGYRAELRALDGDLRL